MRFTLFIKLFNLSLILASIYSCDKRSDESLPTIEVFIPHQGFSLNSDFQIILNAKVFDEFGLSQIEMEVLNEAMVRVSKNIRLSAIGNVIHLDTIYTLSNQNLPSGKYFFRLKATNLNGQSTSKFISFYLDTENFLKEGFLVYGIFDNREHILYQWTGYGDILQKIMKFDNEIINMRFNIESQILAFNEAKGGDLIVLDINDNKQYSIPGYNVAPWQYFTYFDFGRELLYIGFYNGPLKGYNKRGVEKYSSELINGNFPLALYPLNDYLIVCETQRVGNTNSIATFFKASGYVFQNRTISFEFESFVGNRNESVLLMGKENNSLFLYELFFKIGVLNKVIELNRNGLINATLIGSNLLLAVFSDEIQVINLFDRVIERNLKLGESIRHADFNKKEGELVIVTNKVLKAYSIPDLNMTSTLEVQDVEFVKAFRL